MIIFLIVVLVTLFVIQLVLVTTDMNLTLETKLGATAVIFIAFFLISTKILYMVEKEEMSIQCLKGKNEYKMEISYELKDSVYIPKDTIYVKIDE